MDSERGDAPGGPGGAGQHPHREHQAQRGRREYRRERRRRLRAARRRKRRQRPWPLRLVPTWRLVLAAVLGAGTLALGGLAAGLLLIDVPAPKAAAQAQNNVYLYADGTQLARVGEVNRQIIALEQVPRGVRRAVMAAEDRDFYDSGSVDLKAMARAAWNMLRGEGTQSGSTITQQYVKNYYLHQEQTLARKVREFFIALELGRTTDKEEILAGYLNTSYFGRNAYGIQSAAQAYYGKDAADLTTAEGAYLAALLNAPGMYDVGAGPGNEQAALARWEYVVDGMVSEGWLPREQRARMTFPEPLPSAPSEGLSGDRGYLVEAVGDHLTEQGILSEEQLAGGGYRITTSIEPKRQEALRQAVSEQLLNVLSEDNPADGYVRVGASSVEVATGRVVAMYGGTGYTEQFVNNATRRDYQAASTFKPIVYAAAREHAATTQDGERIGARTQYAGDSGRTVLGRDGQPTAWAPENWARENFGPISVHSAMDKSVNAVFAQMGMDVGPELVRDTAVALGLPGDTPGLETPSGSIALGTATPSTLDMAEAYATLARHGLHREPVLVDRLTRNGRDVALPAGTQRQAVSREAADGTTAVLRSVVEGGTGTAAQAAGRPAAGKTGTAEEDRAAWFAAYTPELATVVAAFGQDPESGAHRGLYGAAGMERFSGGSYPARIWAQYTAAALAGEPVSDFVLQAPEVAALREPEGTEAQDTEGARDLQGTGGTQGVQEVPRAAPDPA